MKNSNYFLVLHVSGKGFQDELLVPLSRDQGEADQVAVSPGPPLCFSGRQE